LIDYLTERILSEGEYIANNGATVRDTGKHFGVCISTVHKDMTERLKYIDKNLYDRVIEVLQINKKERLLRGGIATKNKYKGLK
jgi:putative DeoR family transcriptional regulator (stage III sporulation protein D)